PRSDAEAIWKAGVAAVDSARLVRAAVRIGAEITVVADAASVGVDAGSIRHESVLEVCGERFDLASLGRLIVVGAGKAGAGMALGLEEAFGTELLDAKVEGWINVPADCVRPLRRIHLHAARPAGLNEPTEAGVFGSQRILELVESLRGDDLCLVLISGGGSALLPLPIDGISLADKQAVTRHLSRAGATIHELNAVRKRLSRIKGGGLLRAARAGRMIALIISDVIGDPIDVIASGPTVCDHGTAAEALAVLERSRELRVESREQEASDPIPVSVWNSLRSQVASGEVRSIPHVTCRNCIIGNNETALTAAIDHARSLGHEVRSLGAGRGGVAREMGVELAEACLAARRESSAKPICFVGGGEPVVKLVPTERPRLGGRNQEVALSACCRLWNEDLHGLSILSGGTDGEDGPTDAAGAICDETIRDTARQLDLDPFDFLSINDSYTFFDRAGGLLKTGPTHTNVMDLQVAVVRPSG
ncbi:MAG: DUF4147 domain-containing protein, partial [Candidatus Saccharimonas sp.]|nr:DUF4147 domain-containing protein [Planctomycetaceae bacterium]